MSFAGFAEQDNVSPEWLVNPATRRRLKLDKYYPEAGVAVRFLGLAAKGQGRQSDWEVLENEQRDQTRADSAAKTACSWSRWTPDDMVKQLDGLLSNLARASRAMAQSKQPDAFKTQWIPALAAARDRAEKLRPLIIKNPEQMEGESGRCLAGPGGRDHGRTAQPGQQRRRPAKPNAPAGPLLLAPGQRVRHIRYGDGVVTLHRQATVRQR